MTLGRREKVEQFLNAALPQLYEEGPEQGGRETVSDAQAAFRFLSSFSFFTSFLPSLSNVGCWVGWFLFVGCLIVTSLVRPSLTSLLIRPSRRTSIPVV